MLHVIATVTLLPGQRDAWLAAFDRVRPAVLAEDGCDAYEATAEEPGVLGAQSPLPPDTVVIVERWRDAAALRAHSTAPHMAAYRAAVKPLVKGVAIHVLRPL
jgi:quinol monooxygenase YgiN